MNVRHPGHQVERVPTRGGEDGEVPGRQVAQEWGPVVHPEAVLTRLVSARTHCRARYNYNNAVIRALDLDIYPQDSDRFGGMSLLADRFFGFV